MLYINPGLFLRITWTHANQLWQNCPKQSKGKLLLLPFLERVCLVCSSWQRVCHCSKTWPDFSGAAVKSTTLPVFMTVASVKLMPTHKMSFNYNDWLIPWWILTLVYSPATCWHFILLDLNNTWIATCSGTPVAFQSFANLQACKAAQGFRKHSKLASKTSKDSHSTDTNAASLFSL